MSAEENELKILELSRQVQALSALLNTSRSAEQKNAFSVGYQVPAPKPIDMQGNIAENIKFFKLAWKNYEVASGLVTRPPAEQVAVLLSIIGEDCYRNYVTYPLTAEDRATTQNVLNAIEKYLVPTTNKRYERAMFNMAIQQNNECIDEYVLRLRNMVKTCEFKCDDEMCNKDMSNEFLLDKLCISIKNVKLRAKLYDDKTLTL